MLIIFAFCASGCAARTVTAVVPPEPVGPPWQAVGQAETFDRKTVWQAINGAAEVYIDYGFVRLTQQTYSRRGVTAEVQIYDLARPINAWGVFRRERPDDARPLVGAAGVLVQKVQCLAHHGRHYLRASAMEGEFSRPSCRALLLGLKKTISGPAGPPVELSLLPKDGQSPGSLRYEPRSFLGLRELERCLWASYVDKKGKTYKKFVVIELPAVAGIDPVWTALSDASTWKQASVPETLSRSVPYQGVVVVTRANSRLVGVAGLEDQTAAVTAARELAIFFQN